MDNVTPADARAALDAVEHARAHVAGEVGLPRWYWWLLAAAWLVLGVLGDTGPHWLAVAATLAFGIGHSMTASRLLSGRRQTGRLQVSADTAGRRIPAVVVAVLLALVVVTIGVGFLLHADGARHPGTGAAVAVAVVVGFGGPEILRVVRRWARA
jgi:hypothetical protein